MKSAGEHQRGGGGGRPQEDTRAQRKLPHTWIIQVVVKQDLVRIGRIDGPTEYSPYKHCLNRWTYRVFIIAWMKSAGEHQRGGGGGRPQEDARVPGKATVCVRVRERVCVCV